MDINKNTIDSNGKLLNKDIIEDDFFKLLKENNKKEIEKFLVEKGKKPKSFCPIMIEIAKENSNE